jgi:hypothetical protein
MTLRNQTNFQNTIKWELLLNAAEIGVTAKEGNVSLTGVISAYQYPEQLLRCLEP